MARVRNWIAQRWLCLAAILLLWSTAATVLVISLRMNHGHLIYTLDDSYILMAMARNFARHGVWGMTPLSIHAHFIRTALDVYCCRDLLDRGSQHAHSSRS